MHFIILVGNKPVYKKKFTSIGTAKSIWGNYCTKYGATDEHISPYAYAGLSKINPKTNIVVELRQNWYKSKVKRMT